VCPRSLNVCRLLYLFIVYFCCLVTGNSCYENTDQSRFMEDSRRIVHMDDHMVVHMDVHMFLTDIKEDLFPTKRDKLFDKLVFRTTKL
jgi:hypothetical protein